MSKNDHTHLLNVYRNFASALKQPRQWQDWQTGKAVNAPNDQPEPGESCEGGAESESADRQAEDGQAR